MAYLVDEIPAATRMYGSFKSSNSGEPSCDSGFTDGCNAHICKTEERN